MLAKTQEAVREADNLIIKQDNIIKKLKEKYDCTEEEIKELAR